MSIENLLPLGETTLITNSSNEPSIQQRIASEIPSSQNIEIVMAFITYSGIAPYLKLLQEHVIKNGAGSLRVITTTFTNITDLKALSKLIEIGAMVKVSYDTTSTRLHAKGWNFLRNISSTHSEGNFSTTYIGSSNLTMHGLTTGREWNVRASSNLNPNISELYSKIFEVYWLDDRIKDFNEKEFIENTSQDSKGYELVNLSTPYNFQQDILDELSRMRALGFNKNLLVAATGTGKTVISAYEIKKFLSENPTAKILFVAHREEILIQSMATFRHIIGDRKFGDILTGSAKPKNVHHLFAMINSLRNSNYKVSHFDYIIIDEAHHSSANSYKFITDHISDEQFLLGLTATPERMDGTDIRSAFGNRFACEIRLWDALNDGLLTPFSYYGLGAGDISEISFANNKYNDEALYSFLTTGDSFGLLLKYIHEYLPRISENKCLIFCQSVSHAHQLQDFLSQHNFSTAVIDANTPSKIRNNTVSDFKEGRINFILTVDVFNEGIDIPEINSVILLRPTASLTIFIQQLGRGLRLCKGKNKVVILDFVFNHNRKFNILKNYQGLLNSDRPSIIRGFKGGGFNLPEGSEMQFDEVATQHVLENIKLSIENSNLCNLLQNYVTKPSIIQFVSDHEISIEKLQKDGWAKSLLASGLISYKLTKEEVLMLKKAAHCYLISDTLRVTALGYILENNHKKLNMLTTSEKLAIEALLTLLYEPDQLTSFAGNLQTAINKLHLYSIVIFELTELHQYLLTLKLQNRISYEGMEVGAIFRRQEIQIFTGRNSFGFFTPNREGVDKLPNTKGGTTYLLYVTIDKSDMENPGHHYNDYAINRDLFHWQSQNSTSPTTGVGKNLIETNSNNNIIYLFARLNKKSNYDTTAGYYFLGEADYSTHKGSKPISFILHLKNILPNELFQKLRLK